MRKHEAAEKNYILLLKLDANIIQLKKKQPIFTKIIHIDYAALGKL